MDKRYYVNCSGYLCDKDLSNTLSIFECADLLNNKEETINWLKKVSQDYEDLVADFFWKNWLKFDKELQEEILLLFNIDGDDME